MSEEAFVKAAGRGEATSSQVGTSELPPLGTKWFAVKRLPPGILTPYSGHVPKVVHGTNERVRRLLRVDTLTFFSGLELRAVPGTIQHVLWP